jgi:hypothetical protein
MRKARAIKNIYTALKHNRLATESYPLIRRRGLHVNKPVNHNNTEVQLTTPDTKDLFIK